MSRSDVLVDADWVEAHLDDPKVVIVEVDEDTSAYDKNHIKNAVRIDWKQDLQDPVRRDFVDQAGFEKLLSAKGIANDDTVVLYGGNNNWFASYAYWYFKLYGHQDVKLLDGGRKKWELDSRDLVAEVRRSARRPSTRPRPQDTAIRAFRDDVVAAIGTLNLVDVRSPDEFSGKLLAPAHLPQEQSQRPGHVPERPQHPVVEDGQRRRHLQVRRRAQGSSTRASGVDLAKDTIAYCRIGERSALHLVRAARAARPDQRQELRRLLDRVRLAGRRADRARRRQVSKHASPPNPRQGSTTHVWSTRQAAPTPRRIKPGETTIQGSVTRDGEPVTGYVRLLDSTGEFTAEVPTSATGQFRFYAAEGTWTLRALVPGGTADRTVVAQQGGLAEVAIAV